MSCELPDTRDIFGSQLMSSSSKSYDRCQFHETDNIVWPFDYDKSRFLLAVFDFMYTVCIHTTYVYIYI